MPIDETGIQKYAICTRCIVLHTFVRTVNKDTLDESPMAYKNIFEVMEMQKELVDVVCHLKPLINIKG